MEEILKKLRVILSQNANEEIRISNQHFFKEEIECYGIRSATVSKISKDIYNQYLPNKKKTFETVADLIP
jgi:3-methyladenine DNA glycosylase AlkD